MRSNGYKVFLKTIWLDTRGKNFRMAIAYVILNHKHIILHYRMWLFSFCLLLARLRRLNLSNPPLRNDWHLSGMIKRILVYCHFSCNSCFFHHAFLNIVCLLLHTVLQLDSHQSGREQEDCCMFFSGFASSTKLKHLRLMFQILQNWSHVQFETIVTTAAGNRNCCLGRVCHIMCA